MNRLIIAAAFTLFIGTAFAAPGTAVSTVNLRSEANTTSNILGKVGAGSRVDVGDCTGGWCAVTWQAKSGFVIQTSLDMSGRPVARARRIAPGSEHIVAAGPRPPGYVAVPPPAVVYAPGYFGAPYYYGPRWGGYYGPRWGYGWRRW
jgi:Bacterial SH3 domain